MIDLVLDEKLKKDNKKFNFDDFYINGRDFILIKEVNIDKLEKGIREARKLFNLILVEGSEKVNRAICESKDLILFCPWKSRGRLNHILLRSASKNNTAICFSFDEILCASKEERVVLLNKIKEIIKLCRKFKVKIIFASLASEFYGLRNSYDMISFLTTLGMEPGEARKSLTNILEIEKRNKEKKSGELVREGVKIVKYLK